MATTYRITLLGFPLDTSTCPPAIVSALWPSFDGSWPVTLSPSECLVSVPASAPAPADLGPLVKVELVSE
jgi:hypothetical protein